MRALVPALKSRVRLLRGLQRMLKERSQVKRLLKDTDHKVSTISTEVGFGTQQSFYTAFRAAEQLTPTQYRKAARKG